MSFDIKCALMINQSINPSVYGFWLPIWYLQTVRVCLKRDYSSCILFTLVYFRLFFVSQALVARNSPPPPFFSNFLFTDLFSIKFLYFFISSSLFPYFNLLVSIFIQSYVNSSLHVTWWRQFSIYKVCQYHQIIPILDMPHSL